ncbi:hypothetical protein QCA50_012620 [Cerrena zonata]|uniref:DEAD/DEAH-box helicase domain-containing protein n=1 Tax=Cerrena zonata TaxID=2478898 RepID=A0AAW0G2U5_9APHY
MSLKWDLGGVQRTFNLCMENGGGIPSAMILPSARARELNTSSHLVLGMDLLLVIAPWMGKTVVLLAPLLHAKSIGQEGITLVVMPSKFLTEEEAATFCRVGVCAQAVNEDGLRTAHTVDGCNLCKELVKCRGVRSIVITPWMFLAFSLNTMLIKPQSVNPQIEWCLVDEIHLTIEAASDPPIYLAIPHLCPRLHSSLWAIVNGSSLVEALTIASLLGFRPSMYSNLCYFVVHPKHKSVIRFHISLLLDSSFMISTFSFPSACSHSQRYCFP